MADAATLLVEVLRELRASIDGLAQDQALHHDEGLGSSLALSIIDGLLEIRGSVDKLADQQAEFQRDVMSVLSDIARDLGRVPEHADTLSGIERDLSLIADRYRPLESDLSPNLDDCLAQKNLSRRNFKRTHYPALRAVALGSAHRPVSDRSREAARCLAPASSKPRIRALANQPIIQPSSIGLPSASLKPCAFAILQNDSAQSWASKLGIGQSGRVFGSTPTHSDSNSA